MKTVFNKEPKMRDPSTEGHEILVDVNEWYCHDCWAADRDCPVLPGVPPLTLAEQVEFWERD